MLSEDTDRAGPSPGSLGTQLFSACVPWDVVLWCPAPVTQGQPPPSWGEDRLPALWTDPLVPWVDVSPAQPPRLWQVGGRPGAAAECPEALRHSPKDTADSRGQGQGDG